MKKIVAILITLALIFSLVACGKTGKNTTRCDDNDSEVIVYLKWSDGEEELHPKHINFRLDDCIELILEDGRTITTSYTNVIIIEK